MAELAIIIPAYKERYFRQALQSLVDQTDKNFHVYIGDDCSPQDLKSICEQFAREIPITYTRFESNMGAKRLVDQWSRCVALTKDEAWLWMFSDDDILDRDCVKNFYLNRASTRGEFDIFRFNTKIIDGSGLITSTCPSGPNVETSEQLAYNLLMGRRGNSMGDHIFSREVYIRCGGFVFTEYAQGADWAMSISFTRFRGLSIIPNAFFYWRLSDTNISARGAKAKRNMVNGHLQFLRWVINFFRAMAQGGEEERYREMLNAVRHNLKSVLVWHYHGLSSGNVIRVLLFLWSELKLSLSEATKDLLYVAKHTSLTAKRAVRLRGRIRRMFSV